VSRSCLPAPSGPRSSAASRAHYKRRSARSPCASTTSDQRPSRLAAKDVIDVQLTVADLDARLAPLIEAAGFTGRPEISADHRPPGATGEGWDKLFFQPRDGRPVNLHVRVAGAPNQRYALLFRDYLKAHSSAGDAYAELKRRLAALGLDRGSYAEVKDPACDLIMVAAEEWAARTGWTP
jgi:GrpB-like predicted nucleotidyltransferase (UPF0157 family)